MTRPPMTPMIEPLRPSVVADVVALDCAEPLDMQLCRELSEQVQPELRRVRRLLIASLFLLVLFFPAPAAIVLALVLLGLLLLGLAAPLAYFPLGGDQRLHRAVRDRLQRAPADDATLWAIVSRWRAKGRTASSRESYQPYVERYIALQVFFTLEQYRFERHHRLSGRTRYCGRPLAADLITWDDGASWHVLDYEPALDALVLRGAIEVVYPGLREHVCGHLPATIGDKRRQYGLRRIGRAGEQAICRYHWEQAHRRSGGEGVAVAGSGWDAEEV